MIDILDMIMMKNLKIEINIHFVTMIFFIQIKIE